MRNLIIRGILFLILILNPNYDGKSSVDNVSISIEEWKRFSQINDRNNLIDDINEQYSEFYSGLYNYRISARNNKINMDFINKITCYALESESLPSIVIAQAILETGYGRYDKLEFNIFGIKGKGIKSKTREFVNGRYIRIKSEFQKFDNFTDAFDRHYNIIGKYGFVNRDYKDWAWRIKNNGYATDPRYAQKLIYIIEMYDLVRLDSIQVMEKSLYNTNNMLNATISHV